MLNSPDELKRICEEIENLAILFGTRLDERLRKAILSAPDEVSTGAALKFNEWINGLRMIIERKDALLNIKNFVDRVRILEEEKELYLGYVSLSGELQFENLVRNPSVVPAIIRAFEPFFSLYAKKYKEYHESIENRKRELRHRLEPIFSYANAVVYLSRIEGLCSPEVVERSKRFIELGNFLRECPGDEIDVRSPFCRRCGLSFASKLPEQELLSLSNKVENDITDILHRISRSVIKGIIKRNEKIDAFVKAVTVSNLNEFAKILDDEIVEFLRSVLE